MAGRPFVRRRDGRIEVRLTDAGRAVAGEAFSHVVAAQDNRDHEWHPSLHGPINPANDVDDPVAILHRQHETMSNVELAVVTLHEDFLNDAEAWAWLCSLQIALRATITAKGIMSSDRLDDLDDASREYIKTLQSLLFSLADVM